MSAMAEVKNEKNCVGVKFPNQQSWKGKNLAHYDFRLATLIENDFTDCDLSYTNFEGANCWGANFTHSKMHRTNFKDAVIAGSVMNPRDMFGVTMTFTCDSLDGMKLGHKWYLVWLFLLCQLQEPVKGMTDKVIGLIGTDAYVKLRGIFGNRAL